MTKLITRQIAQFICISLLIMTGCTATAKDTPSATPTVRTPLTTATPTLMATPTPTPKPPATATPTPTTGATEGFAFYFPAQEIATTDILVIDLNNFELSDQPIISLDDIVTYSKNTHEIELTPAACERIRSLEIPVRGLPFVACVDRQPIYGGAFWVGYSSVSFNGIAINVLSCDQSHRIRIQLGYPESPELFVGEDYRADRRILQSLAAADKLK